MAKSSITPEENQKVLKHLNALAKLMDNQFKIPGTEIRFGLDGIIGLIPGIGDLSTFAVSGYMLWVMSNNGASGFVLARMTFNILLDALVGSIPLLGDLFDFAFKANIRNMKLMQQHYEHGRHNGSAWKFIVPLLIVVFLVIVSILYGMYKLLDLIF